MFAKYWTYLKYVVRHKWFVFKAGIKYKVPVHQLILHDLSKFGPSEFTQYANFFFGYVPTQKEIDDSGLTRSQLISRHRTEAVKEAFDQAWNHHQKSNKHHWNYWVMFKDDGSPYCLPMPDRFIREMVADWVGAGMAISGKNDAVEWYQKNRHKIRLNPVSRIRVHELLGLPAQLEFITDQGHTKSHLDDAGI